MAKRLQQRNEGVARGALAGATLTPVHPADEATNPTYNAEASNSARDMEAIDPAWNAEVTHPAHNAEVTHPAHNAEVTHPAHSAEVANPTYNMEAANPARNANIVSPEGSPVPEIVRGGGLPETNLGGGRSPEPRFSHGNLAAGAHTGWGPYGSHAAAGAYGFAQAFPQPPQFSYPFMGAYSHPAAGAYSQAGAYTAAGAAYPPYPGAMAGAYPFAGQMAYSGAGVYPQAGAHPGQAGTYPGAGAYSAMATYPGTPAFPPASPAMAAPMPQAALPAPASAVPALQSPVGFPQAYPMPLPFGAYPVPYPASYAQANYIQNVSPITTPCLAAASQCPASALALGAPQASCPAAGALAAGARTAGSASAAQEAPVQRTLRQSMANAFVNIALVVALVLVVAMMFGGASGMPVSIAGYSWATVLTDSMSEVYPRGSLVVAQKVPSDSIRVGDDIMFMAGPDTSCTHRVVEVVTSEGTRAFRTQGTSNPRPDNDLVHPENVVGKVVWSSVPVGAALTIIRDNWPYIVFLLGCACILKFVISRIYAKDAEPVPTAATGTQGPAQGSSRNPFSHRKKTASGEAVRAPGVAGGGNTGQAREGPPHGGAPHVAPFGAGRPAGRGNTHGIGTPLRRGPTAGTEGG